MCGAERAAKNHSWHRLPVSEQHDQSRAASSAPACITMHAGFSAGVEMQSKRWVMGSLLFAVASLVVMLHPGLRLNAKQAAAQSEEPVPAYHAQPPGEALPETLDPAQFDNPVVKNSYALAAKVKKVLYQQPCYCHCDRAHGHTSLLNCFTTTHGSL